MKGIRLPELLWSELWENIRGESQAWIWNVSGKKVPIAGLVYLLAASFRESDVTTALKLGLDFRHVSTDIQWQSDRPVVHVFAAC